MIVTTADLPTVKPKDAQSPEVQPLFVLEDPADNHQVNRVDSYFPLFVQPKLDLCKENYGKRHISFMAPAQETSVMESIAWSGMALKLALFQQNIKLFSDKKVNFHYKGSPATNRADHSTDPPPSKKAKHTASSEESSDSTMQQLKAELKSEITDSVCKRLLGLECPRGSSDPAQSDAETLPEVGNCNDLVSDNSAQATSMSTIDCSTSLPELSLQFPVAGPSNQSPEISPDWLGKFLDEQMGDFLADAEQQQERDFLLSSLEKIKVRQCTVCSGEGKFMYDKTYQTYPAMPLLEQARTNQASSESSKPATESNQDDPQPSGSKDN